MQHSVFEKRGLDAFVVVLMACKLEATRCCVNIVEMLTGEVRSNGSKRNGIFGASVSF